MYTALSTAYSSIVQFTYPTTLPLGMMLSVYYSPPNNETTTFASDTLGNLQGFSISGGSILKVLLYCPSSIPTSSSLNFEQTYIPSAPVVIIPIATSNTTEPTVANSPAFSD